MLYKYLKNWIKFKTIESSEFIILLCTIPFIVLLNFALQILIWRERQLIVNNLGVINLLLINSSIFILLMLVSFIKLKPKINTIDNVKHLEFKYFKNYMVLFLIFFGLFDFGSTLLLLTNMNKYKYIICMIFIIILPIIYLYLNIQIKHISLSRILFVATIIINNLVIYYFIWPIMIFCILIGLWLILISREWLFKSQVKTRRSFKHINVFTHYFIYLSRDFYFLIFFSATIVISILLNYCSILSTSQKMAIYQISDIVILFFLCINWNALNLRIFELDIKRRHIFLNLQILLFKIVIIICFEYFVNNSFQLLSIVSINNFLIISLVYSVIGDKMINTIKEFIVVMLLIILIKNFFIDQILISIVLIICLLIVQYYEAYKNSN